MFIAYCYVVAMNYKEVIDRFITTSGFQNSDAQVV